MPCGPPFATEPTDFLHLFIDESGDLNFSSHGSPFYVFTAVWTYAPRCIAADLGAHRELLLSRGQNIVRFHAQDDPDPIRRGVFEVLQSHRCLKAAAIIVRKSRTNPALYKADQFYPQFLEYLIKFVLKGEGKRRYECALIFTDLPPTKLIGKALRFALRRSTPAHLRADARFHLYQHPSASHLGLQVADYCSWAVNRYCTRNDVERYRAVMHMFDKPPLDVFERGRNDYY